MAELVVQVVILELVAVVLQVYMFLMDSLTHGLSLLLVAEEAEAAPGMLADVVVEMVVIGNQ